MKPEDFNRRSERAPAVRSPSSRRALLASALLVLAVLIALDLMRADSLILGAWEQVAPRDDPPAWQRLDERSLPRPRVE